MAWVLCPHAGKIAERGSKLSFIEEMLIDSKSAQFETGDDANVRTDTIGVNLLASGDIGNCC